VSWPSLLNFEFSLKNNDKANLYGINPAFALPCKGGEFYLIWRGRGYAACGAPRRKPSQSSASGFNLLPPLYLNLLCYAQTQPMRSAFHSALGLLPAETRPVAKRLFAARAGYMLVVSSFGWPLVVCGTLKVVCDFTLLKMFQSVKPPEEYVPSANNVKRENP
jgi:hypothetical protein